MSSPTPEPANPTPAAQRAERRLARLEEMAELGMQLLRDLPKPTSEAEAPCIAEAFARISRAVRLTLALEEKSDRFLAELLGGALSARQAPVPVDPALDSFERQKTALRARKANAFDLLVAVSESEGESLESVEKLFDALAESPDEVEASFKGDQRLAPTIETVCARLGLGPELSSRVAEGWACGYLAARPRFNPWPQSAAVQAPP